MRVKELHLIGAVMIQGDTFNDERGHFRELFQKSHFSSVGIQINEAPQISISYSNVDVLRGLHTSMYFKLVSVVKGEIYDVIVDLREDSPTYLKWSATVLSAENKKQVFIPKGCAHGFYCMRESLVSYIQGGMFDTTKEKDINPFDPFLNIFWPESFSGRYNMSEKDRNAPYLRHSGFCIPLKPLQRNLIIGGSGQVGGALLELLEFKNCIGTFESSRVPAGSAFLHISLEKLSADPCLSDELLMATRPNIVFICAAFTWVDGCEKNAKKAYAINALAPRMIAEAAKRVGAKIVFYSSDYVFDGSSGPYDELSEPNPINIYGKTKLEGERLVLDVCPDALILRTTIVYGPEEQGKNFIYQLTDALRCGKDFVCAEDQYGSPTYNRDLARMTVGLLEKNARGIYNCSGREVFNRYEFALHCTKYLGYDENKLVCGKTSDMAERGKAMRGMKLGLNIKKTLGLLDRKYHPNSVHKNLKDWLEKQRGKHLSSLS